MRHSSALALVLAALSLACRKEAPPPPMPPASAASPGAPSAGISGRIVEKIDASQYSYLRLATSAGDIWTAVPQTKRAVGADATVLSAMWMQNFKSATLNRTWDKIAFGVLQGEAPDAPPPGLGATPGQVPAGQMPPGHPATADAPAPGAGMFAREAASATAPPPPGAAHTTAVVPDALGKISVARAAGAQGRTVAELYAQKAALKDKTVSVRGKVVKETDGVMGKNWLHLRDGTGDGATADLTVASGDAAAVGDTVLATGVVHLDRDLGAGYRYDLLVEDAKLKKE